MPFDFILLISGFFVHSLVDCLDRLKEASSLLSMLRLLKKLINSQALVQEVRIGLYFISCFSLSSLMSWTNYFSFYLTYFHSLFLMEG
ncbi:hypothetical protein EON65_05900 [archaeon]|nr:MAG: hypothetical protein EON65_05900 [archaeon]